MISTLKALSNSPSLQNGNLSAFYAQAKLTLAPTSRNAVLMDRRAGSSSTHAWRGGRRCR